LASVQDIDGGVKDDNRRNKIWETAYVSSALSGKTWNQIMQKFDKPAVVVTETIAKSTLATPTLKKVGVPTSSITLRSVGKPKSENSAQQNTAAVINTTTSPSPAATKTETPQKNWFARLLDGIFGSF